MPFKRASNGSIIISLVAICFPSALYCFYVHQKGKKSKPPVAGIPYHAPPPHWFVGHARFLLASDPIETLRQLVVAPAKGDCQVSSYWIANYPTVAVLNAKLVNRMLQATSNRTINRISLRHFTYLFGETSILFQNGKDWRAHREIIHKAFTPKALKSIVHSIWEMAFRGESAILSTIDRGKEAVESVELLKLSRILVLDTFGVAAYDYDFGCTSNDRLQYTHPIIETLEFLQKDMVRRLTSIFSPTAQFYWLPSPLNYKNKHHSKILRDKMREMIQKRRSKNASSSGAIHRQDLLQNALTGSRRFDNLSDDFLSDWLVTSVFGGYDTQSLTLFGSIYYLAKHRNWQGACHEEARHFFHSTNNFDTSTDPRGHLPLIHACYLEATRCYSPVILSGRILEKPFDMEIDSQKVVIPAGTKLQFPLYWIHHNEKNFSRPDEYLPQRWVQRRNGSWEWRTEENDMGGDVPIGDQTAVFAFLAGGRNCVGKPLAERISAVLLATLLRSVDFELVNPRCELELKRQGANIVPVNDVPIRMSKRLQV